MATLAQNYQQNEDDKNKQISSAAPTMTNSGQTSGTFASQNASQAGTQAPSSSGRFSNISNYLKANKNPQSLGQTISSNIQGQGQKVQSNLQSQQQDFQKNAEANRNVFNQNLVSGALNNAAQFVQDPNQLSAFEKQRTGQYSGPKNLSDEAALNAQAANAQRMGQQTGNESGQFGLLRQMFGRPSYSQGQQKLDQLFVQSGPKDQFSQARRAVNQAGQQVQQGEQQAGLLGKTYGQEAQETNKQTIDALTGKTQEEYKTLDQRVAEEKAKKDALVAQLQGQLGSGSISQDYAKKFGLGAGTQLYNLNLNDYLNVDPTEANRSTIASAEDYAKFNALNKLAGQQGPATEFANQDVAGKFLQNQVGFDTNRFNQALASTKAAADTALAQAHAQDTGFYNALQGLAQSGKLDLGDVIGGPSGQFNSAIKRAEWLAPAAARGEDLSVNDQLLVQEYNKWKQGQNEVNRLNALYNPNRTLAVQ